MEHKLRGNQFFKNRKFSQARACYKRAIREDPTDIIFYSNLAAVHLEEHDYKECIETCKKGIAIGSQNKADVKQIAKSYARMGKAFMKEQNFKEAVRSFEDALANDRIKEYESLLVESKGLLKLENNPMVEVGKSNIEGRGVFAVRDIAKDEAVCLYDGELLDESHLLSLVRSGVPMDREYWMSHPRDPRLTLCGYKTPKTVLGIGQLMNDSQKPEITKLDFKEGIKSCEEYVINSRKGQNVTFNLDGRDFWLYAARDIKKGEELFLHYGYKIWLETFTKDLNLAKKSSTNSLWRLLYWALDGSVHGMVGKGQAKVFKIENAYDFDEKEYQSIVEVLLEVPKENMEENKRIPNFSYKNCFISMINIINIDHVDSFLD